MGNIITLDRSVIPACDVPIEVYEEIVKGTADVEKVGAYKVGFFLGLQQGLPKIVELTRKYTDKPVIYDHQKAGTDIPDVGGKFMDVCKNAGIDAVILFPQSGAATQEKWTEQAMEKELGVIVGGLMTHPKYKRSEGGYIADEAILEIYQKAVEMGVTNFVVPGNRPDDIKAIREAIETAESKFAYFAPGFIGQGGVISDGGKAAGDRFHAIVGRGIYKAEDKSAAAKELTSQI